MSQRKEMAQNIRYEGEKGNSLTGIIAILSPRLWKVLVVLTLPFIVLCANYGEALEQTGNIGAYFADMLLPVAIIGYVVLIFVLRHKEI